MAEVKPDLAVSPEKHLRMIRFDLEKELFGFEIRYINQVIEPQKLFFVPRAPFFLRGALNHRGKVIAVIDLAQFFGMKAKVIDQETRVIILDPAECGAEFHIGFLVERVQRIETIPAQRLAQKPESEGNKPYISGVVNLGGRLFNIINLEKLLQEFESYFG